MSKLAHIDRATSGLTESAAKSTNTAALSSKSTNSTWGTGLFSLPTCLRSARRGGGERQLPHLLKRIPLTDISCLWELSTPNLNLSLGSLSTPKTTATKAWRLRRATRFEVTVQKRRRTSCRHRYTSSLYSCSIYDHNHALQELYLVRASSPSCSCRNLLPFVCLKEEGCIGLLFRDVTKLSVFLHPWSFS